MDDTKALFIVCEALTAITRDMTDHGPVDVHDLDILDITLEQLQFDSLDRIEMAMEIEKALDCNDIPEDIYENWKSVNDVVMTVKSI